MKKLIEASKKLVSTFVIASFICSCAPAGMGIISGTASAAPIQSIQQSINKSGSSQESTVKKTTKKKKTYSVKKVKAAKKTKSKSARSVVTGDAAYESSSDGSSAQMVSGASGLASKIAASIRKLVGSTAFRGADVKGGSVACAKVVSTALKNAGAINKVILGVPALVSELKNKGFKEVKAPPFKAGDVVTWRTYDRNRDGKKDNDTHVGIVDSDGKAISNSSSRRMPRRHSVNYAPICRVLRKA